MNVAKGRHQLKMYKDFAKIEIEVFSTAEAAARFLGYSAERFYLINTKLTELNKNTG